MAERLSMQLWEPQQAHQALGHAWAECIKPMLMAGHRLVLEVKPESKTREQEKLYHALIGEAAKQSQHLGSKWQEEDWKRLLLDKFARDTGRTHGRIIPNLDATGVVEVGVLSRKFSKADASEFVEWLYAWCAENGIETIDMSTGEIK